MRLVPLLVLCILATGCGGSTSSTPGATFDRTVGAACSTNATCDVTGTGRNACSLTALPTLPTPICVGLTCTPGSGGLLAPCDGGSGVCSNESGVYRCVPACSFGSGGSATGCTGKNVCAPMNMMVTSGTGICDGGCIMDADCPGRFCDTWTGQCSATSTPNHTKSVGALCTAMDQVSGACLCYPGTSGYATCTQACTTGQGLCPTGFTCDPGLSAMMMGMPTGIQGACLKSCTSPSDCPAPLDCVLHGGGISGTCQ